MPRPPRIPGNHFYHLKRRLDAQAKSIAANAGIAGANSGSGQLAPGFASFDDTMAIGDQWSLSVSTGPTPDHHWQLNAGSGTTATDSEGSLDGTINGATWTTTAKTGGQALDLDDDSVTTPDDPIYDTGANEGLTIMAWVQTADASNTQLVVNTINNSIQDRDGFALQINSGDARFYVQDGSTLAATTGPAVADGSWHHLTGVYRAGDVEIWVDGTKENTNTNGFAYETDYGPAFGADPKDDRFYFDGIIDDVRFFDRALSASDIDATYQDTK